MAKQGLLDFDFRGSCKIIGLMGYFKGMVRVAGVDKQLSNSRIQLSSHFSAFEVSSQREAEHTSELSLNSWGSAQDYLQTQF